MLALAPDDCLSARAGRLFVEDVAAEELARRFGTPLFVISEARLRGNARRWRAAVADAWPHGPTLVLPSLKANTVLALRRILDEEGLGCDVFGLGELELALRAGVPPDRISLNGATKADDALARALGAGVRITLDSLDELERTRALARGLGAVARVRLRLRPWLPDTSAGSDFAPGEPAHVALQDYRAGMVDAEVDAALQQLAARPPGVELLGLMAHASRQTTDLGFWAAYAEEVGRRAGAAAAAMGEFTGRAGEPGAVSEEFTPRAGEAGAVSEEFTPRAGEAGAVSEEFAPRAGAADAATGEGWRPRELDLGGGFAIPRDPTGRALPGRAGAGPAPDPAAYARALAAGLERGLAAGGLEPAGIALQIEPGRAVYGDAGLHLATVRHVKEQAAPLPRRWIETDTSEAFLADVNLEHSRFACVLAGDLERPPRTDSAVTGISCGFDVLIAAGEVPDARAGELVAFLDTGAYQDATASNFNALARPATVLVSGAEARVVRRAETLDDLLARELP